MNVEIFRGFFTRQKCNRQNCKDSVSYILKEKKFRQLRCAAILSTGRTAVEALKTQHFLPYFHFATLIYCMQMKLGQKLVESETVLQSQTDDCRPILVDFRNEHFSVRIDDEGRKNC